MRPPMVVASAVALALPVVVAPPVLAGQPDLSARATNYATFAYTGASQTWTVPVGVQSVGFTATGGFGGGGGFATVVANQLSGVLSIPPGALALEVNVGGNGANQSTTGAGGWNGGGAGGGHSGGGFQVGAGGGGATDIRLPGAPASQALIVAGGGGGFGGNGTNLGSNWYGGPGGFGGLIPQAGTVGDASGSGSDGGAGGAGGAVSGPVGGAGEFSSNGDDGAGGGGGGGWNSGAGGGAGQADKISLQVAGGGGGGGGQSYADPTYTSGVLDTVNGGQFSPGASLAYLSFDDSAPTKTIVAGQYAAWSYNAGPGATYALASGSLPPGMALGSGGILAGTPLTTGVFTFAVSASLALEAYGGVLVSNTFTQVTVTANGPTPPTSPTLVSAVGGAGTATVVWNAPSSTGSSPLVNYVIGVSPNGGQTWSIWASVPAGAAQTVYTGSLSSGTYVFQVSAVNQTTTGSPSANSQPVTVTSAANAPTNVTGTPGNASVALSWTAPTQTGGAAVTGYFIRYSTDGGGSWAQMPNTGSAATSATVGNLTSQAGYIFEVAAINSAGTSPWSAASSLIYPLLDPGAPSDVVATSGYLSVDLSWLAPPSSAVPVTGYAVRYSDDSGTTWSAPVMTGSTTTSYTYANLSQPDVLIFQVAALGANGMGAWSAPSAPVTAETRASAPTKLRAQPSDRRSVLTWDPPVDLGGGTLTGYRIDYRVAGTAQWKVYAASTGTSATRYDVTDLANGTSYEFRVAAITSTFGVGFFSQTVAATPFTVPDRPTNVQAVAGNATATITWTAPGTDNGRRVVGYRIEAASGTGWYDVVTNTGSTATTYAASGLTNGTTYLFRVSAINAAGTGPASVPSPPVIPATTAGAPTQVVATAGYRAIAMRWTPPVDTGGLPITGYRVRWQASGGAWRSATTGGPAPYFAVTSLRNGVDYAVHVAAVTAAGRGAWSASVGPLTPLGEATEPRWLSARPGKGRVQLTWQAPRTTGGAPVEGYVIALSVADGPWSTQFASAGLTTRIDGLETTLPHRFRVAAMTAGGRGEWSWPTAPLILNDTPARPLVNSVKVRGSKASITVTSGSLGDVQLQQWTPDGDWQPVARGVVTLPRGIAEARVRAIHRGNASPDVRIRIDRPTQVTLPVSVTIDGDRSRVTTSGTARLEWRYGTTGGWTPVSNPLTLRTPRPPNPWTLQVQAASATSRERIGIEVR